MNLNVVSLVCGSRKTEVDDRIFMQSAQDQWKYFYPNAEELIPLNIPKPRCHVVKIRAHVDANHAGNLATRGSHMGVLIYLNNFLIIWFS